MDHFKLPTNCPCIHLLYKNTRMHITFYQTDHLKQPIKQMGQITTYFSHFQAGCSPSNKTHWTCHKELTTHSRLMSLLNCNIFFKFNYLIFYRIIRMSSSSMEDFHVGNMHHFSSTVNTIRRHCSCNVKQVLEKRNASPV